jgi:signal transduction histidine kinase
MNAELHRLASAVPFAMLMVDYTAVVERFSGLTAAEVTERLEDDAELLACTSLVRHLATTVEWVRLYGAPGRDDLPTIASRLPDPAAYPSLRSSLVEQLAAPFNGISALVREHLVPTESGEDRVVRSHWSAGTGPDGSPDYSLIVIADLDITELRVAESSLAASDRLESIGRLAAGIAHEINTPMQYIGDNTRFLAKAFERMVALAEKTAELHSVAPEQAGAHLAELVALVDSLKVPYLATRIPKALEQSLDGVETVTRIVRSMKEHAHPGASRPEPVDLNEIIRSTLTVSRNEWKYVADMELDLSEHLEPVLARPGELNQVILNIVVNAAHAIADRSDGGRGTIAISTAAEQGEALIRITDDGGGMTPEVRLRVFEPFFTTKGFGRGTGQGLSISRAIIEDHHKGSIAVESEPGLGTTFEIRLPILALAEEVPA